MKKIIGMSMAVALALAALGAVPAAADSENAAGHLSGAYCVTPFGATVDFKTVENNNVLTLQCNGYKENLSGKTEVVKGFGCGIASPDGGAASTTKTRATWAASGQISMTCIAESTRD